MEDIRGKSSKAWKVFQDCYKLYDKYAKQGIPSNDDEKYWDNLSLDVGMIYNEYAGDPVQELVYGITSGIIDYFQKLVGEE